MGEAPNQLAPCAWTARTAPLTGRLMPRHAVATSVERSTTPISAGTGAGGGTCCLWRRGGRQAGGDSFRFHASCRMETVCCDCVHTKLHDEDDEKTSTAHATNNPNRPLIPTATYAHAMAHAERLVRAARAPLCGTGTHAYYIYIELPPTRSVRNMWGYGKHVDFRSHAALAQRTLAGWIGSRPQQAMCPRGKRNAPGSRGRSQSRLPPRAPQPRSASSFACGSHQGRCAERRLLDFLERDPSAHRRPRACELLAHSRHLSGRLSARLLCSLIRASASAF